MVWTWTWISIPALSLTPSCLRQLLACAILFSLFTTTLWVRCTYNDKWGHRHPEKWGRQPGPPSLSRSARARLIRDNIQLYQSLVSSLTTDQALTPSSGTIALAVVFCNSVGAGPTGLTLPSWASQQMRQLRVMIKSLLLTEHEYIIRGHVPVSGPTLELNVFTDNPLIFAEIERFLNSSSEIGPDYRRWIVLKHRKVLYPQEFKDLKYLLHPCATYRLFLSTALPIHDSIIYLDTDVIFFRNVRTLHDELQTFNKTQWVAMGPDSYHTRPKDAMIPFYGAQGINSGVGVYNLTRMRSSALLGEVGQIYKRYKYKVGNAGDQDLLNIYFSGRPEELKLLACEQNYITYFCAPTPLCTHLGKDSRGIAVLHGTSGSFFHSTNKSQLAIVFQEYEQLKMNRTIDNIDLRSFYAGLKEKLLANQHRNGPTKKPDVAGDDWEAWFEASCAKSPEFVDNLLRNLSL